MTNQGITVAYNTISYICRQTGETGVPTHPWYCLPVHSSFFWPGLLLPRVKVLNPGGEGMLPVSPGWLGGVGLLEPSQQVAAQDQGQSELAPER